MSVADIVQLNISLAARAPTAAGFGRTLILAYHTHWVARTKLYSAATGLADMVTDGFAVTDQAYLSAQTVLQQSPQPPDFKIGRRALPFSQVVNLIPTVTTVGFVYSGSINGVAWSYTVIAAATVATVSTALAALFGTLGVTGVTFSGASATWVACTTTTPGNFVRYTNMAPELHVKTVTADPGIVTDMTAVNTADTDWFGLLIDSESAAEVTALAAWVETQKKQFFFTTADYACKDPASTTDIFYVLHALNYFGTAGFWHQDVGGSLADGAMAVHLSSTPGSATLAHKAIKGVTPSDTAPNGTPWLTQGEYTAIQNKYGNTYQTLGSQGDLFAGNSIGGDFVDNVRFIYFMYNQIQITFIGLLQGLPKLPMTDKGISKAANTLLLLLNSYTKDPYNALDGQPANAPTVAAPLLANISPSDIAIRRLPNVTFACRLQGAIHLIQITGTVSE